MKRFMITITLLLVLLVGDLFANPVKPNYTIIKKSGNVTYLWDLAATTPIDAPSSKELNNWISEMEELGFECIITRVIPISEALEKHTDPIIDEVLLARSHGYYSVGVVFGYDFCFSFSYYSVSKKDIFQISFVPTI